MVVGFTGLCLAKVFFFLLNNVFSLISKVRSSFSLLHTCGHSLKHTHTHVRTRLIRSSEAFCHKCFRITGVSCQESGK